MRNRWGGAIAVAVTVVGLVFGVAGCSGTSGSVVAGAGTSTSAVSSTSAAVPSHSEAVTSSSAAPATSSTEHDGNPPTGASNLKPFVGTWIGHTRELTISANGIATEQVYDGCCTVAWTLRFSIDHASGTHANGQLYVTLKSAMFNENPQWPSPGSPEAQIGNGGIAGVQDGVFSEPFASGTFCDKAADLAGKCGA
ncbi:hypothetical protein [Catenulispora sp. GAS73]|uniref:hypothetical protein n=1 Tax=Catenulispora sp. GAS73 TaxID=3156269 RepID=UPI003513FB47